MGQWTRDILTSCGVCGGLFETSKAERKRGRGRYCSLRCAASIAAKHRDQSGQKNPNWKGGERTPAIKGRRYRDKYPDKNAAHAAVTRAVRRGHLKPLPCLACGARKTEAHHFDYSKPLNVVWLCKKHHLRIHRESKSAKAS